MQKRLILHIEGSSDWDDQSIRILAEIEGLQARGHAVVLVARPTSEIFKRAVEREIQVEAVSMDQPNVLQTIWQVMRVISNRQVDIVNTHASRSHWVGALGAWVSRRQPVVIQTRHHDASALRDLMRQLIYEKFWDYVITTSENMRQQLTAKHSSLSDRIVSVSTGVDLTRFDPSRYDSEAIENELGYTKGPRVALTGVFTDVKCFKDIIQAAAEVLRSIPETRFYIVGSVLSADVQHARKVIAQYRLQNEVFILGYREDFSQVLSAVDLVIHCSSAHSALPQMILQALAMEKPVVAAKVGAISAAVFDGVTGYLVPHGDVQTMTDRVINLLQDDIKRKAFGQAGRRLVKEKYGMQSMLDRIEQLYKSLLKKRGLNA